MKKIILMICTVFCVLVALSGCGDKSNEQNMVNSVKESSQEETENAQNDVSVDAENTSDDLIEEDESGLISDSTSGLEEADVKVPEGLNFTEILNSYAVMEPNYVTALGLNNISDYYLLIKNIYDNVGSDKINLIYSKFEYNLYIGEYITYFKIPDLYQNQNSTFDFSSHIDAICSQYTNEHPMEEPECQEGKQICEQIANMLVERFDADELYPVVVVKDTGKDYYAPLPSFILGDIFKYHEFLGKQ